MEEAVTVISEKLDSFKVSEQSEQLIKLTVKIAKVEKRRIIEWRKSKTLLLCLLRKKVSKKVQSNFWKTED